MNIQSLPLLFLTACLAVSGCGSDTPTVPTDQSEMEAYLEEHPELVISDEELNSEPESGDID
ncbi:hypothetical protein [Allorhodopirellula solitaria]|uniref:Secreted protein n=1 Tax=Allorhodopirellula solitaria TaxID=2527987 RepID=A0A5C5YK75_9BACT|nr:hypothetical protein [Allorhodopirellula solitaria]TWT75251.1 hypothetical protein CA85_05400 [Allorhodopirellula solitaria]